MNQRKQALFAMCVAVLGSTSALVMFSAPMLVQKVSKSSRRRAAAAPVVWTDAEEKTATAATTAKTTGTITWRATQKFDEAQPLRGQTVLIEYEPPSSYFRGDELMWMGELRSSYVGDDEQACELEEANVMTLPLRKREGENSRYTIEVAVPAFCQEILFAVTDGVRFDSRDERWHRIVPPRFVEEVRAGEETQLVVRERDVKKGVVTTLFNVLRRDAGDLERAVNKEMAERKKSPDNRAALSPKKTPSAAEAEQQTPAASLIDDFTHVEVSVSRREQRAFQEARERSNAVGESLGLSNVAIGDVRMAFERTANDRKVSDTRLARDTFADFLAELGFDEVVEEGRDDALWARHVGADAATLEQCLHIYHQLDEDDEGLNLV